MPKKKKKHWRTVQAEEAAAAEAAEAESAREVAAVIVAGSPSNGHPPPSLGVAIENVRLALEPFDGVVRKKIVKAATSLLG